MSDLGGVRRLAYVVGVVAALAVVGTSAAAVVVDRDPATLTLRGPGHTATIPASGWTLSSAGSGIGYQDAKGRTTVVVRAPAVYAEGSCAADRTATRAFVGFVPRAGKDVRDLARTWAAALTLDTVTGKPVGPVRLSSTSKGRIDADLTSPEGPCNPPRIHLTVVEAGSQALVLVRDLDVDGDLSASAADAIVSSVRPAH